MQLFSFVALLSYDVYVKKLLIEKILDNVTEDEARKKALQKADKDKKNRNKDKN